MGFVDVHIEEETDTTCTLADTFYPVEGAKYVHEKSGDWSIAGNRLRHHGVEEEVYKVDVLVVASCGGGADVTLSLGTEDQVSTLVERADFRTTCTVATSSVRPIPLSGIVTLPAGWSELELLIASDTAGRTVTVHSLAINLIRAS